VSGICRGGRCTLLDGGAKALHLAQTASPRRDFCFKEGGDTKFVVELDDRARLQPWDIQQFEEAGPIFGPPAAFQDLGLCPYLLTQ
jgi:hypothetical protein